ncbi:hypothetical protein NYE70_22485 [Paenibacillus sp. FSL R5-0407]|uniref:hypothetical protein n=1 Tax=Paenibacillus sp. FSL R5-0407 TaxID=2975320 RepID=UPI0030FADDEE
MKAMKSVLIMICLFLMISALPDQSFAKQDYVFKKDTGFFGSDLFDVAYGNGVYVAVGGDGAIVRSEDSEKWYIVSSGVTNRILSVTFGNGMFVAVGDQNLLLTSTDGVKWSKQTLTITKKNVPTWTEANKGDFTKSKVQSNTSVIWDGQQFVLLTQMDTYTFKPDPIYPKSSYRVYSPTGYAFVSTSKDGMNWKTAQISPYVYDASKLKYINGMYCFFSRYEVLTSKNLVNWNHYDHTFTDATFGPQGLVIVWGRIEGMRSRVAAIKAKSFQGVDLEKSKDLLDWSDAWGANALDYVNGRYVINADGGNLLTSTDATTWNAVNMFDGPASYREESIEDPKDLTISDINPDRIQFFKTIWDGHQYISVSSFGGIYTSGDLKKFKKQYVEGVSSSISLDFSGIGYESGTYYIYGSNGLFLTSPDALNWKNPFYIPKQYVVKSASYNGKDFALAAEEEDWKWASIMSNYFLSIYNNDKNAQDTGVPATKIMSELDHPVDVKWDGQAFIARTHYGDKYKIEPGVSGWQDISPPNPQSLKDEPIIVKGNNHTVKYQYLDDSATIMLYYLENGKWIKAQFPAWTEYEKYYLRNLDNNSKEEDTLSAVIYGNNEFMTIGAGGLILRSEDGKVWTKVHSGTSEYLTGIIWDGKQYIIVGNKGTYLTCTP